MTKFAIEHCYDNFIWLAKRGDAWLARDGVPASLLQAHDVALAALDADPNNRKAAVAWLDACDAIERMDLSILDRPAVEASVEARLRKQAEQRKFDHMLFPTITRP